MSKQSICVDMQLICVPLWVRGHPRIDSLPLLQVVEGDLHRTRAHQRLKTGDLRRPPYLLFGSFMVVVLAYSQFPYRTKEQNNIPEEGPPVWSGKYENRPVQRNRKGIRFLMSLAKIKSNMNLLVSSNPRFYVENGRKTMMMIKDSRKLRSRFRDKNRDFS